LVDTLAGGRILRLAIGAGDRGAFASTGVEIERLAIGTRFTHAVLIAADFLRTTTQPVCLSIADITEAGVRVRWSTLTLGDTQMLAADLTTATVERLAFATQARLTAATDMAAAAAVGVIRLGIDTMIAAVGFAILALTLPIFAGNAGVARMTTGAAVVRIGVRIDALLVTTRRLAPEATAVVLALFTERFRRHITVRTAVGFGSRVARTA
jgi:hypothetical protein